MASFADVLAREVDRPVRDLTGLDGKYDIRLEFTERMAVGLPSQSAPELFTALTEQLGLKLESARGPVEVLVIDSVERPTPD
jgi:uncharacterized protein (TIGR03435 family)